MKKEVPPKDFYLRKNKGHLKGFQTNLKHFLIKLMSIPPAETGPDEKILPAHGTNQIAGLVEFRPLKH